MILSWLWRDVDVDVDVSGMDDGENVFLQRASRRDDAKREESKQ